MHNGILSAAIENGTHWPWPSRSFWLFYLIIIGNSACPRDNSSQTWTGITKFAPNMHPGILSAGIENGGHWPWPWRSLRPFWLRILGHLVCPFNNLQWIWAGTTKVTLNMHIRTFSAGIENGRHRPWPSRSFGHLDSEFQETAISVVLVYWSGPAKGCYTSQTWSCYQ